MSVATQFLMLPLVLLVSCDLFVSANTQRRQDGAIWKVHVDNLTDVPFDVVLDPVEVTTEGEVYPDYVDGESEAQVGVAAPGPTDFWVYRAINPVGIPGYNATMRLAAQSFVLTLQESGQPPKVVLGYSQVATGEDADLDRLLFYDWDVSFINRPKYSPTDYIGETRWDGYWQTSAWYLRSRLLPEGKAFGFLEGDNMDYPTVVVTIHADRTLSAALSATSQEGLLDIPEGKTFPE